MSTYEKEPEGDDAPSTQVEKLKAHLMGLDALTPLDPEVIAIELGMESRYVKRQFGFLENAMVEWQDGTLVRSEIPFDPGHPDDILRSCTDSSSAPGERPGRIFHSRRHGVRE